MPVAIVAGEGDKVVGSEHAKRMRGAVPDGCRLWDIKTNQKLDKDRFRQDLGGVEEAYQEVARRLGLLQPEDESAVLDFDQHRKKRGR